MTRLVRMRKMRRCCSLLTLVPYTRQHWATSRHSPTHTSTYLNNLHCYVNDSMIVTFVLWESLHWCDTTHRGDWGSRTTRTLLRHWPWYTDMLRGRTGGRRVWDTSALWSHLLHHDTDHLLQPGDTDHVHHGEDEDDKSKREAGVARQECPWCGQWWSQHETETWHLTMIRPPAHTAPGQLRTPDSDSDVLCTTVNGPEMLSC